MAGTWFGTAAASSWRGIGRARRAFRRWRRTRPFWAGLFTIAGGTEILLIPLVPLPLLIHEGIAGVSGLLMGALMVVMGLSLWVAPQFRVFAGVATILFSLASFVTSNFGGLLLGMLLGIVGGPLAVAWTRTTPPAQSTDPASPSDPVSDVDGDGDGPAATDADGADDQPSPDEDVVDATVDADGGSSTAEAEGGGASAKNRDGAGAAHREDTEETAAADGDGTAAAGGRRYFRLAVLGLAAVLAVALAPAGTVRVAAEDAPLVTAVVPTMHARTTDMSGLSFDGVVPLSTADGPVRTLKFTMDTVVMRDYSLDAPGDGAAATSVTVGTLTLTSNVSFYTTRMSGLLGGVLPVTFTPDTPPPLVLSETRFTDFTSEQVFVTADTLRAEGLTTRADTA